MGTQSSMRGGRGRKLKAEINVVPYIDVMLVLLVIFMVAAPLTNPSVINLPTSGNTAQPPAEFIQIGLKPDAAPTIGITTAAGGSGTGPETVRDRAALMAKLRELHAAKPELAVMIAADKNMKYDDVIQTIAEAKKMGVARVALATK
ncbi:MAG TPA: biopolymer transporter ExbD [Burkholderiaceae bacterium]